MRQRFDRLAKQILTTALEPGGRVDAEYQVVGPAQAVDVWFRPDPALVANLESAGLLGRMAQEPCMLEPFRNTPGIAEMQSCVGKQHALAHENAQAARQTGESRPGLPRLWVVSTGRPDTLIDTYEYQPMPDWPAGCYRARLDISRLFLVVVRELPVNRETLLLRLLGRGPTFERAVEDLAALPPDAWERRFVSPLLVALAFEIPQDPEADMEAREYLRETRALYAEWEKRVRRESREQGREEGREQGREQGHEQGREQGREQGHEQGMLAGERTLLRKLLVRRFDELPAELLARLDSASSEQLELWGERVLTAESLADVFGD